MRKTVSTAILIVTGIAGAASVRDAASRDAATGASPAQARSSAPAAVDVCALLTKQEAAAAVGEAVKEPTSAAGRSIMPGAAASMCEYEAATGLHKVHVNIWRTSADAAGTAFRQTYQMLCAQKGREGLAGLGYVACWYNAKHEELQVLKGATIFSIELRRSGDPTEPIKAVAKEVLGRLP